MRRHYRPMLAQEADKPFSSNDWIFEVKWDGIRGISYVNKGLSIESRNKKELVQNFPELKELNHITKNTVLDGEIIVMKDGKPDFQALAKRSKTTSVEEIKRLSQALPSNYIVFDILEKDGKPLLDVPLINRKKILKDSVRDGTFVVVSSYVETQGEQYYEAAIAKNMEGVMAKKKDSHYQPGIRSAEWLKIKPTRTCDCVIFGYTVGKGAREYTFGALVLGMFDGNEATYVGKEGQVSIRNS